jgi:hypothetical protein
VRPSVRRWFRARLDRDPRRWTLVLSALGAVAVFATSLQGRRDFFYGRGVGVAVVVALTATLPATGAILMLVHGRLLYWTGRALRGRATAPEIHAAYAWGQLPLVVASAPLALEIPLRAIAAEADPIPAWLGASLAGLDRAAPVLEPVAIAAALAGAAVYVKLLAEAQRFSSWRALANQLLAGVGGLAILVPAILVAEAALPEAGGAKLALAATPLAAVLGAAAELALRGLTGRRRGASPPRDPSPDPPAAAERG